MFTRHHRKVRVLFGLSDVVLTALAFEAAYQTRYWLRIPGALGEWLTFHEVFYIAVPVKALLLGFSLLLWLLLGLWIQVYDRLDSAHPRVILRDTFRQCGAGIIGVVLFQFVLRLELSRAFISLFAFYSWALMCLFRLNAGSVVGLIRREFGALHFVMVVGVNERAARLGAALEQSSRYGIRLEGFLAEMDNAPETIELSRKYPVYPLGELSALLRRKVIDEVIFAVDSSQLSGFEEVFLLCDDEGVRTRVAVDFFPHVNSDVYLDRLNAIPLLTFSAAPHDDLLLFIKRVADVLLAGSALLLALPFLVLVVIAIRLTSPGPAIFRQERCGLNGRRFVVYKFRSMCRNAEEMKGALQHLNSKTTAFKIPDDPRLTPVGRILRKFSIDEVPQLWNVLKGDMALVGPRPAVPDEVEQYQRWQRRRLRMRPGLTCLWALAGRDSLDFETWMKMDMQYIDSWSLALDWKILLRTIPRVLSGKGAH
ncbi:MAG: exopolysaccharide biosynthesis polyprenyl glycosylphosphotransferase [Acidobacteria bacterium]|nr:exopolysaccharide biosynthesis polyprenyl glycosylphosphotransferase [Acidobacteriota bacterium]